MYISVNDLGLVESWSQEGSEAMIYVDESIVPANHTEDFSKKRWLFVDGSFVERVGWLDEWNMALQNWEQYLLSQQETPAEPEAEPE
jgi:hypothetical protein